jgi:hypothetical protein
MINKKEEARYQEARNQESKIRCKNSRNRIKGNDDSCLIFNPVIGNCGSCFALVLSLDVLHLDSYSPLFYYKIFTLQGAPFMNNVFDAFNGKRFAYKIFHPGQLTFKFILTKYIGCHGNNWRGIVAIFF